MSDKNLAPYVRIRELDANGNPLAGGKLYTYRTGTSTPKTTYSDATGTVNANPIILDSEGSADVWIDSDEAYRFRLETSTGALRWQRDGITNSTWATVRTVATIADLKLISGSATDTSVVIVAGYYAVGDGGGGEFYWSAASTATDNGGTIIKATAVTTGRWLRVHDGPLSVKWFGAKGDGATDDSDAFHAAIAVVAANGGGQVDVPCGRGERYAVNLVIANQRGVHLNGTGWTKQSYANGAEIIYGCLIPADVSLPVITIGNDVGTNNTTLTSGTIISNITMSGGGASRGQIGMKIIGGAYRCVYDNVSILGFTLKGLWSVAAVSKFAYYQFFTGLSVVCGDAGAACIYIDGSNAFTGDEASPNITSHYFDKVTVATGTDAACRGVVVDGASCSFADTYIQLSTSRHDLGMELIQRPTTTRAYPAPVVSCNNVTIDGVGYFNDVTYGGNRAIPTVFMNIPAVTAAGQKPISNYLRGTFSIDGLIRLYDSVVPATTDDNEVYEGSAVMTDFINNYGSYSWFRSPTMTRAKVVDAIYFANLVYPEYIGTLLSVGTGATPLLTLTAPGGFNVSSELQIAGTKVVGTRVTGWTAATGAAERTTFATTTVTTEQLARKVKALIDDLIAHGLIGA